MCNLEVISKGSLDSSFTYMYSDKNGNDIYRHGDTYYMVVKQEEIKMKKFWDMVNSVNTLEDLEIVRHELETNDEVDVESYNDMMIALSQISRELYRA